MKFRSPQKPRVISIRHGGTCGSKNFGQKSSFAIFTANVRFGRLRTGTCRTSRRIAPTGRGLGAEDPLEGLFLGQNCRAVRMGVVPRCYAHCAMAKFRSEVSCPHPSPPMGPSAHFGAILATMPCSQRRESALNRISRQFCPRNNSLKAPLFANPPTGGAVRRAATPSSGHRGPRGHFWVLRPPLPAGQSGRLSHDWRSERKVR